MLQTERYRIESQTPTMLTTTWLPRTPTRWGGIPCQ